MKHRVFTVKFRLKSSNYDSSRPVVARDEIHSRQQFKRLKGMKAARIISIT